MNKRFLISLSLLIAITTSVHAQKKVRIELQSKSMQTYKSVKNVQNGFILKESLPYIDLLEEQTKQGTYLQLTSEGTVKSFYEGNPNLPLITRLIELPFDATAKVTVKSFTEEIISLSDHKLSNEIIPAQASVSKSDDPEKVPFVKNAAVYKTNAFFKNDIVKFTDKGYLRNKHLGYIEISPFEYNPVTNQLKVLNNIEIEVSFIYGATNKQVPRSKSVSQYFDMMPVNTVNSLSEPKDLIEGPVKYVIVSDPMFEETLQPFIEWKKQKGFNVIEAYTNNTDVGNTNTSIKAYLKDLYENPDDGVSPTFVLFVGDVAQIPAFSGTSGSHKTDLYYCEYTDDKLPEVFYGRFSANNVAELQPQIDKTLEVEKYTMPDPSYLDNVVLVAGVDGSYAPTHGNGFVNYANEYYINTENGITSISYLYPESGSSDAQIRDDISAGAAIANYTAHCNSDGWADPTFTNTHVPSMTNEHMYPLMIGNCCLSNKFDDASCFGETLLRAENKGAVGYIGASNNSLWDEDYFWGIGVASISANPTYEGSSLGAYDRFFHLNGESEEDWFITQGQMFVAGNLAVEASSSSNKTYYWEIYHLMGDPSLVPYVKVPTAMTASYNKEVLIGTTTFNVAAEKNSYVALTLDGELLDARLVGDGGTVLSFNGINKVGELILVITKQNRQPYIDTLTVKASDFPYISMEDFEINDVAENNNGQADYGENVKLNVTLKNYSDIYDAFVTSAALITSDTNITMVDSLESYGTILKSENKYIENAFTFKVNNFVEDGHDVEFFIVVTGQDSEGKEYEWKSKLSVGLNAPEIELGDVVINDLATNHNSILDPGETVELGLVISNNGSSLIEGLSLDIELLKSSSYVNLLETQQTDISIEAESKDTIYFSVSANAETPIGILAYLSFSLNDNLYQSYSDSINKQISIGELSEILITDNDTAISTMAYFYDSGGAAGVHGNNENDTITISPSEDGSYIVATFKEFSIEPDGNSCYDYLNVYNGADANAELIDSYCDSNVPETIVADNEQGALTFVFISDSYVTQSGWKAEVKSTVGYEYTILVNGINGPLKDAVVMLNDRIDTTDVSGMVSFTNVPEGINYNLKIIANEYKELNATVNVLEDQTQNFTLEYAMYDVTFNLSDEDGIIDGEIQFDGLTIKTNQGFAKISKVSHSESETFVIQSFGHLDSVLIVPVTSDLSFDIELKAIKYDIGFNISDGTNSISNATVEFNNSEILTNESGLALFEDVKMDTLVSYIIRKTGFNNYTGTTNVLKDSTINISMQPGTASYKVSFVIKNGGTAVYNAQVILDEDTLYSDAKGYAVFENVTEADNIPYKVTKNNFFDKTGSIDLNGSNVVEQVSLLIEAYTVTFAVVDASKQGINDAEINFNAQIKRTDINGEVIFNDVRPGTELGFLIQKEGYYDYDSSLSVVDKDVVFNARLSSTTGISQLTKSNVKIFPNPSNGIFNVLIENINQGSIQLKVYDVLGSGVYNTTLDGYQQIKEVIDLSDKPKGIYFLMIEAENGEVLSRRILLQ